MKLQILYVNDTNFGVYADTRWDMSSLKADPMGDSVEPKPFSVIGSRTGMKLYKEEGLYIHWIVPDAFTRGRVVDEKEDTIEFPILCDCFKVYRSIRNLDGEFAKIEDFNIVTELERPNLAVTKNGDPAYCANYEQCRDDLGFFDNLKGFKPDSNGNLSGPLKDFTGKLYYTIVGYYSKDENDPLYQFSKAGGEFKDFLEEHNLTGAVSIGKIEVNHIFWFGECIINIEKGKLMCDCSLPDGDISFAIGNDAADAYAAYTKDMVNGRADLMYKFLYEIESQNPYENFKYLIKEDVHNYGFSGITIGDSAKLINEEPSIEDKEDIKELNEWFKTFNRISAKLDTIGEEASLIWQDAATKSYYGTLTDEDKQKYRNIANEYKEQFKECKDKLVNIRKKIDILEKTLGKEKYERVGEDKFWIPTHPCLLAAGKGLHLKFLQGFDDKTEGAEYNYNFCYVTEEVPSNMQMNEIPVFERTIASDKYDFNWKEPWNPLMLEWEISYCHEDGVIGTDSQTNSFMGRSIVSPYYNERVVYLLEEHAKALEYRKSISEEEDEVSEYEQLIKMTRNLKEKLKRADMIEQPLSGICELFMGKEEKYVSGCDQSKFGGDFDEKMKGIYGNKNYYRKGIGDFFAVTRHGKATISKIRIIDSYGRFKEFEGDKIKLFCSDEYKSDDEPNSFYFKPRILIPARFNVDEVDEDFPVFGWIVPNYVDKTIFIYDVNGNAIGYLFCVGSKVKFRTIDFIVKDRLPFIHDELTLWIDGLVGDKKGKYYKDFMKYLESVMDNRLKSESVTEESSVLFDGQVLALTKVKLSYEYMGLEPQPISKTIKDGRRGDEKRMYKEISTIIGGRDCINEGLLLFYKESEQSKEIDYEKYYRVWDQGFGNSQEILPHENEMNIDFYGEGRYITMLMDPTKDVVISSEILPSKIFRISSEFVADTTKNINYCSIIGTLYSFTNEKVALPLPISQNVEWEFKMARKEKKSSERDEAIFYESMPVDNIMESKERAAYTPMIAEGLLECCRVHRD